MKAACCEWFEGYSAVDDRETRHRGKSQDPSIRIHTHTHRTSAVSSHVEKSGSGAHASARHALTHESRTIQETRLEKHTIPYDLRGTIVPGNGTGLGSAIIFFNTAFTPCATDKPASAETARIDRNPIASANNAEYAKAGRTLTSAINVAIGWLDGYST